MLSILELHINDLIGQNVVYTELMISPTIFPKCLDQMVKAFEEFKRKVDAMEKGKIQVEFIMVIPRTLSDEKISQDVIKFIELYKLGFIVGVALVGLENNQSIKRFYPYFSKIKDNGLGIEIHAGEHGTPESVEEAITFGIADRIGHGISSFKFPSLLKKLQKLNTHFEFCITSNLKTGSVQDINSHPISVAKKMGLNFSINTDDPGIFQCSLNGEYRILSDKLGFNNKNFEEVFRNSLAARFSNSLRYLKFPEK